MMSPMPWRSLVESDTASDGCALEDARKALANGGTIADLAAAAVKTAQFKRRTFQ